MKWHSLSSIKANEWCYRSLTWLVVLAETSWTLISDCGSIYSKTKVVTINDPVNALYLLTALTPNVTNDLPPNHCWLAIIFWHGYLLSFESCFTSFCDCNIRNTKKFPIWFIHSMPHSQHALNITALRNVQHCLHNNMTIPIQQLKTIQHSTLWLYSTMTTQYCLCMTLQLHNTTIIQHYDFIKETMTMHYNSTTPTMTITLTDVRAKLF